jgi:hypothetical protein
MDKQKLAEQVKALRAQGQSNAAISRTLGINQKAVWNLLTDNGARKLRSSVSVPMAPAVKALVTALEEVAATQPPTVPVGFSWEDFVNVACVPSGERLYKGEVLGLATEQTVPSERKAAKWADDFENRGEKINLEGGLF